MKENEMKHKCDKNPIISGRGICDPHLQLFEGKIYLYTSHDKNPNQSRFAMNDWTVWSTEDFFNGNWRI